jgi:hypothetical protein
MDTLFIIAAVVFLGALFGSRIIIDKAGRNLPNELKAGLMDLTAKERKTGLIILFVMVATFLAVMYMKLVDYKIATLVYFGAFGAYTIIISIITYRKLQSNTYPSDYIRAFVLSTAIRTTGIIVFFLLVINQMLKLA